MRHIQRRQPGLFDNPPQIIAQPQPQLRIQVGQRLIQQQQPRRINHRPRQRHALHLPARKLRHRPVGIGRQIHQLQRLRHRRLHRRPAHFARAQRVGDILPHRHMRPHRVGLEHHPHIAQPRRHQHPLARRGHQIPAEADLPARRMLQPGHAAQGRGLAAARRAQQHHNLPGSDGKTHPIHRRLAGREYFAQIADLEFSAHR